MKKFWNWIRDDSGGRVLRLEGPIDSEGFWGDEVTPQSFRDELESGEGDIIVWINSQGGNVFAAAEIYTMLRDYPGTVTVRIASYAASAATVVAMAGDVIQMSPTAVIIVHDPMTIAMGNTRDMEKAIEMLNKVKESIINACCLPHIRPGGGHLHGSPGLPATCLPSGSSGRWCIGCCSCSFHSLCGWNTEL